MNKFNVIDHHLLIITRAFEEQESLLTLADFAATWSTLAEIDGLVFYNAGKTAGASQRHKHLQVVPLPFAETPERIPIEKAIASAEFTNKIGEIPSFPFIHALVKLEEHSPTYLLETYYSLLETVGFQWDKGDSNSFRSFYNLLATREWMLVIPRSQESFQSISVNSLGFAGALLVKDEEEMKLLKNVGPMTILKGVGVENIQFV